MRDITFKKGAIIIIAELFSLLPDPPEGFEERIPSENDLTDSRLVLLSNTLEEAMELIDGHIDEIQGLIITKGDDFYHSIIRPHLWHLNISEDLIPEIKYLADFYLDIIEQNKIRNENGVQAGETNVQSMDINGETFKEHNTIDKIRKNEILFQKILKNIPDMVSVHDRDMNIIYSNWKGFAEIPEEKRELNTKCYRTYRGYDEICPDCHAKMVIETKRPFQKEIKIIEGLYVDLRVIPILDEEEECDLFVEWVRDITDRKRTEEALEKSEKNYRELVEKSRSIILRLDMEGNVTFMNEYALDFFGYSNDEILKKSAIGTIVPEKDTSGNDLTMIIEDLVKNPENYTTNENENIRKNGERVWIGWTNRAVRDEDGDVCEILCVGNDLTERRRAEKHIKHLNSLLIGIRNINQLIVQEGDLEKMMKGASSELLETRSYRGVAIGLYSDDKKKIESLVDSGDGVFTKEWSVTRNGKGRAPKCVKKAINEDEIVIIEDTTECGTCSFARHIRDHNNSVLLIPMRSESEIQGLLVVSMEKDFALFPDELSLLKEVADDLSFAISKIKGEIMLLESEKKIEAEKNKAEFYLDLLSHDIGNLHQGISSYTQIAQKIGTEDKYMGKMIDNIAELTERSQNLVKNVKLLSRIEYMEHEMEPIDLAEVIEESIGIAKNMFSGDDIVIKFNKPDEPVVINAEPIIQNIFVNLIHNGVKAQMGDVVKLDISLGFDKNGNETVIEISDHGPGIPKQIRKDIFKRREQSTKEYRTGIGLSLVSELVERYSGIIEVRDRVEGDPTKGAKFVLRFPLK